MSRLIVSGCSNTYGHGLPDISLNPKGDLDFSKGPSKLAWPQKLADRLKVKEIINLSCPAQSNKLSAYKITDIQDIRSDDIVVVLWTYVLRTCILEEHPNPLRPRYFEYNHIHKGITQSNKWSKYNAKERIKMHHAAKDWIKWNGKYSNDYNLANENMVWVTFANDYVKRYTNNIFNYSLNDRAFIKLQKRYGVKILKDFSSDAYSRSKALDNSHPGEGTHEYMAKIIYRDIRKEQKQ